MAWSPLCRNLRKTLNPQSHTVFDATKQSQHAARVRGGGAVRCVAVCAPARSCTRSRRETPHARHKQARTAASWGNGHGNGGVGRFPRALNREWPWSALAVNHMTHVVMLAHGKLSTNMRGGANVPTRRGRRRVVPTPSAVARLSAPRATPLALTVLFLSPLRPPLSHETAMHLPSRPPSQAVVTSFEGRHPASSVRWH